MQRQYLKNRLSKNELIGIFAVNGSFLLTITCAVI